VIEKPFVEMHLEMRLLQNKDLLEEDSQKLSEDQDSGKSHLSNRNSESWRKNRKRTERGERYRERIEAAASEVDRECVSPIFCCVSVGFPSSYVS